MASVFVGDDEEAHGQQLDLDEAPDLLLESDGLLEFFLLSERGDLDHGLCSSDLACCQRDSISAILESAGGAPPPAKPRSSVAGAGGDFGVVLAQRRAGVGFS